MLEIVLTWFLNHGIKILIIVISALVISKVFKAFILKVLKRLIRKSIEVSKKKGVDEEREKTLSRVAISIVRFIVWIIAFLMVLPELGVNTAPLLAGLGVSGLALGLGARSLIQDYLSGLFILIEDQFQIGEDVEIAGIRGKVKDLNLRRTVLEEEKTVHYIPNNQIKKVRNFSRT